jgi:hypothetical protein
MRCGARLAPLWKMLRPRRANCIVGLAKRDTLCDTLVLGVLRAYKDLGSHRGLVSC